MALILPSSLTPLDYHVIFNYFKIKKNIMRINIIIILAISLISCKKDLKETPYSTLSPGNIFTSEAGLKQATMGIYQGWTSGSYNIHGFAPLFRWALSETGHQYATAGVYSTAWIDPYTSFAETPSIDQGQGSTVWRMMYSIIAKANAVISNANKAVSDANVANIYIAEAKFNRAYAYFNLVRDFGRVPLTKEEITSLSQSDLIFATQSSMEEIYAFIIADLQFAEKTLPDIWNPQNKGRITNGAAKALLGKVYLTMAGKPIGKTENFQKAVDKLSEVAGGTAEVKYNYGLLNDFKSIFSPANEYNKEIIFSYGFIPSGSLNGNITPFFSALDALWEPSGTQCSWGMTYKYYQLFEENDIRRDFTAVFRFKAVGAGAKDDSVTYDPATWHYINQRTGLPVFNSTIRNGLGFGKTGRQARPVGTSPWYYPDDVIEIRYADILLMLAEALNEVGKVNDALILLNRVRQRANASQYTLASQEDIRLKIRKERKLELMGEGTTVYDIRRWGTLQEEMNAMDPRQILNNTLPPYSAKLELYPIPQVEIDANPKLVQNPGW